MTVDIRNEQNFLRIDKKRMRRIVNAVLSGERARRKDVTILLTNDRAIRKFHKQFLGKNRSTDVMAFNTGNGVQPNYLGDVVVSVQTAKRVAARYKSTARRECERYAVHGVLHLLGYRDHSPRTYRRMHAKQEFYVNGASRGVLS